MTSRARNPLGHGIQHTSGIEMAIRVVTMSSTLALLGEQACDGRTATHRWACSRSRRCGAAIT